MQFKEIIETLKSSFDWLIDFISKPLAGWSFTIALAIFGYMKIEEKYKQGIADGAKNSVEEIKSLKESGINDDQEIFNLNSRITLYKRKLDTCRNNSNSDLSDRLDKMYQEQDRINKIIDNRTLNAKKLNETLNTVLK